ncbi:hypothetical protein VCV18_001888 [Metarhizium anisopliae]
MPSLRVSPSSLSFGSLSAVIVCALFHLASNQVLDPFICALLRDIQWNVPSPILYQGIRFCIKKYLL